MGSAFSGETPARKDVAMTDHEKGQRIFSMDVIRGLALIGILVTAIWELGGFTPNQQTFFRTGTHGGE